MPLFAFSFNDRYKGDGWNVYDPVAELKRQGLPNESWQISRMNEAYEICDSYPKILGELEGLKREKIASITEFVTDMNANGHHLQSKVLRKEA